MTEQAKQRPEFRNINLFNDVPTYRLPPAGFVSILHRVSGLLMFLLLPFILWMLDASLTSEISFDGFTAVFAGPMGWFLKLVCLALIWAYLHHFCAGLRHIFMDVNHHAVNKQFGKSSALTVLALSIGLTLVLGAKLFGLY
ncbi:succinate dehydrogenase, cytochrome b556 subunit [Delftia sp. PS-11]|uniref:succinate dehydrogenase, cytochrome b556 subunit n=1 Tax=Delftia sp. PS-11 TaxID=2767222 RepID=UPI002455AD40|nr:succinate dehydrogenase, cytochrome b556 subunit [Delftia sp. PS-11]KAJ8744045.1 succinate dehydrogenase, cytochrome b556 subunit [Delftia sp. PS-11]